MFDRLIRLEGVKGKDQIGLFVFFFPTRTAIKVTFTSDLRGYYVDVPAVNLIENKPEVERYYSWFSLGPVIRPSISGFQIIIWLIHIVIAK